MQENKILKEMFESILQHPSCSTDLQSIANLDKVIAGKWSANDLLEMMVDEISTAASVGSGLDRAIGTTSSVHATSDMEDLISRFKSYCRGLSPDIRSNLDKAATSFLVHHSGTDNRTLRKRLVLALRQDT
jgi:hypothetical protein